MPHDQDEVPLGRTQPKENAHDEAPLASLERKSQSGIAKLRAHVRRTQRVTVQLWPGKSGAQEALHLVGRTNNLSSGGCAAIFPKAVLAGDVFRLAFQSESIEIPLVFARALRCRMLSENTFETSFHFFDEVEVEPKTAPSSDELFGSD